MRACCIRCEYNLCKTRHQSRNPRNNFLVKCFRSETTSQKLNDLTKYIKNILRIGFRYTVPLSWLAGWMEYSRLKRHIPIYYLSGSNMLLPYIMTKVLTKNETHITLGITTPKLTYLIESRTSLQHRAPGEVQT